MQTVQGPSWSVAGLDRAAGRYPLSFERHVMRMTELFVPGVTAVTTHARYYAVHALIAVEAARRGLEESQVQELLRRAEVVVAAVSYVHEHGDDFGLAAAHGTDAILQMLRSPAVDMTQASKAEKPGYVRNAWGFGTHTRRRRSRSGSSHGPPLPSPARFATKQRSVLAYQGNLRDAGALRFAPIRSSGFRMPRRERAVELVGGRDAQGTERGLCAPRMQESGTS